MFSSSPQKFNSRKPETLKSGRFSGEQQPLFLSLVVEGYTAPRASQSISTVYASRIAERVECGFLRTAKPPALLKRPNTVQFPRQSICAVYASSVSGRPCLLSRACRYRIGTLYDVPTRSINIYTYILHSFKNFSVLLLRDIVKKQPFSPFG
jgi:hypothetical protein